MQWFWAETDTLDTYHRLTGAATLSRAIGRQLLQYQWSIWDGSVNDTGINAGWTVAVDPKSQGALKAVISWVYDKNYTQLGCGSGQCTLSLHTNAYLTLLGLPLPSSGATPTLHWVNTTTGLFITGPEVHSGEAAAASLTVASAAARERGLTTVDMVFPYIGEFDRDAALWVEWL